ncbi:hypothetical protein Hanom_Chr10g00904341 [Helianthus anomalus]
MICGWWFPTLLRGEGGIAVVVVLGRVFRVCFHRRRHRCCVGAVCLWKVGWTWWF